MRLPSSSLACTAHGTKEAAVSQTYERPEREASPKNCNVNWLIHSHKQHLSILKVLQKVDSVI